MNQHTRFGFLSHTRVAKAEICLLIAHASSESSDEPENKHFLCVFFFFFWKVENFCFWCYSFNYGLMFSSFWFDIIHLERSIVYIDGARAIIFK